MFKVTQFGFIFRSVFEDYILGMVSLQAGGIDSIRTTFPEYICPTLRAFFATNDWRRRRRRNYKFAASENRFLN